MSKREEKCYWCGKKATSREHVPPKCLFPEDKDIKGIYEESFRKDLITVPSCDEHNLEKSNDDEYLMEYLAPVVGNNGVAYVHTKTKVARSVARNPKALNVLAEHTLRVSDKEFPVQIVEVDNKRLFHSFEAIGRALYYFECKKQFEGKCSVLVPMFRSAMNDKGKQMIDIIKSEVEREKHKWSEKGKNPEIFKYRLGTPDGFGSRTLLLTFYNNIEVYVVFSDIKFCRVFEKIRINLEYFIKSNNIA